MNFKSILILTLLISTNCKNDDHQKPTAVVSDKTDIQTAAPSPINQKQRSKLQKAVEGNYLGEVKDIAYIRARLVGLLKLSIDSVNEKDKIITGHLITEGKKTTYKRPYFLDQKSNKLIVEKTKDDFGIELHQDGSKLIFSRGAFEKSELVRANFKYDAELPIDLRQYISMTHGHRQTKIPVELNASQEILTEPVLKELTEVELDIIRKSIYARHGMAFSENKDIYFFETRVKGYVPFFLNVDDQLTALEKRNITLLNTFKK